MEGYVTVKEASKILGVSEKTIRRRIKDKEFTTKRKDRKIYISTESLNREDDKKDQGSVFITITRSEYEDLKEQIKELKREKKDEVTRHKELVASIRKDHKEQLKAKDKQIESIDRKLENQQVLHKDLQSRMPMLEAPEEFVQDKKGFWRRLFS